MNILIISVSYDFGESDQGHFELFSRRHGRGGVGDSGALSESLDGFLEIRESAVLVHDLISPSKFLEQEYPDYFCLL
jgi:hypothetical protein